VGSLARYFDRDGYDAIINEISPYILFMKNHFRPNISKEIMYYIKMLLQEKCSTIPKKYNHYANNLKELCTNCEKLIRQNLILILSWFSPQFSHIM